MNANETTTRSAIATFYKDAHGRLTMNALTVIGGERYPDTLTYYDVDYSRDRGCYLYHMSGAGGSLPVEVSGIYAISGADVEVLEHPSTFVNDASRLRNATRRLTRIPASFKLQAGEDFLGWLERNGIHGDAVWCSTCRDCLHEESLCRHTWWCDRTGTYSTPDNRCACTDREQCRSDEEVPE